MKPSTAITRRSSPRTAPISASTFFGKYPETAALVADWTDDQIWALRRGGHDPQKVYTAFKQATETKGQPTCLLIKTVKGYGMGTAGEGQNITHQQKKLADDQLRELRDRFKIPVTDEDLPNAPFVTLNNAQKAYLADRRKALGGDFPKRTWRDTPKLEIPPLSTFKGQLKCTGDREISTTMAFVRILTTLLRDKKIGKNVVPIVPDESRTFGMEGLFRSAGIYNPLGQNYTPEDADQMMFYKESIDGQVLQEGINEAGAMADWIAAATSYSNHGVPMIPFFIYYSMFGLPADRRSGLGRGRQPRAGLHAGRDRWADHAERRRVAARGWPQPYPCQHHPELHHL